MVKKILRLLWRAALGLFGLGLILILAVVLINCFDEDLNPVPAALQPPPNRLKPDQNLYMAIAGIDAPEGVSQLGFAEKKLAQYKRDVETLDRSAPEVSINVPDVPHIGQVEFRGHLDFVKPLISSVWLAMPNHRADIQKLLTDNQVLYQHYLALHEFQGYYDTSPPTPQPPYFFYVRQELRNLFLADIALRMRSTDMEERKNALAQLEADIRTWHVMLTGEGTLLSQMLAVAYLNADYLLLADMIADEKVDVESFSAEFERMVAPFDYADWKTGKSMVHEFQLQQPVWRALAVSRAYKAGRDPIDESWWSRTEQRFEWHFLKKNATSNLNTQYFLQAITVANSDPETLPRARGAYKEWADEQAPFDASYIYNPLGKILISVEASSVDHYLLHAYDIAAMQHMVKLGFEIRHQRIAAAGIPAFMALHPEYSVHPVSRHAFPWSAENYELTLSPQASSGTNRRFSIPVWRGADVKPEMHR